MKELYEKLYDDCSSFENFKNDAHFVSMQGPFYQENSKRFLLIGRSTNGWGSLTTTSREAFGHKAQEQFEDLTRWNWIENHDGTLYSTHDKEEKNYSKRYCLDKKAYWSYTKSIWDQLPGEAHPCDVWMENIAWSNLYKVSPFKGNNPDDKLKELQLDACKSILKKELEIYKPTHILIFTGYDWFDPFADLFENVKSTGERNISRGKNKNTVYVEGTATYGDAKVVITCRPEWRDKDSFVSAVISAFEKN